ncbi:MAG TPA: extracellular solute-binding protein [Thermomicrobiales bacterium]|nr:extracellular solute-binding protein [Thermomicrobiales bacterium]
MSRRAVLAGGLAVGLAACGGDSETKPTPAVPELPPTSTPVAVSTQPILGSPVAGYSDPIRWQGRTLNIAGWGGDIQTAQAEAFFKPFGAATGADVQIKKADLGRLREQIDQEEVVWDVLTVPAEDALNLARSNYLEAIDFAVVDKTALIPEIVLQYSVGASFFSTVIVYPATRPTPPSGWDQFWSVGPKAEDGTIAVEDLRALRRNPIGTLEFALLADGVSIANLYPLDLERAFTSLDKIRDYVVAWYEDGKQPIELLLAEQAAMASAWNVRAWQLGVTTQVGVQWQGGMLSADMWVVPRGAPNKDVAMDFINFSTRAIPSANFGRLVPFGPVNLDSSALLDVERLAEMPTSPGNLAAQFVQNWAWWADNTDAVTTRFEDWLLVRPEATPDSST